MAEYTYYIALQTTGQVVGEIELDKPEFTRRLTGGDFRATVPFGDMSPDQRRDIIELTTPGKYSIVCDRDGEVFGEWLIWTRDRRYGESSLNIGGSEVLSHLNTRLIGPLSYNGVEQLQIARDLAGYGFGPHPTRGGAIAVEFPAFSPSGRTRIRNYEIAESSYGQRLKELSQVIDGFDYDIQTTWKSVGGLRYVRRQFVMYYPRKATPQPFVFDMGEYGGNAVNLSVSEDARDYSTETWALGGQSNDGGKVIAYTSAGEVWTGQGFPFRQRSKTWYSVKEQSTIQSHAEDFHRVCQVQELPGTLSVYTDQFPSVMDYDIGDLVLVQADPSDGFPDGWGGQMRIQAITLQPDADAGEYEVANLEMTPASALPGTEEDEVP